MEHVTIRLTLNEATSLAVCADMELQDEATGEHAKALRRAVGKLDKAIKSRDQQHYRPCSACGGKGRDTRGPGGQNFGCPRCGLTTVDVGDGVATMDGVRHGS